MNRIALVLAICAACGSKSSPPPAGARLVAAMVAAIEAADDARSPWRCAAPDGAVFADETLTVGKTPWKLTGRSVKREREGTVTIGVIADAGGAAAPTVAALGRLRSKLQDADIVIALGGMGTTQAELEATLGALAERAPWPLVALPGDLESAPAQIAAIAALRAKGHAVIDGRLARRIELPGVLVATVPGASDGSRLSAGPEGCAYAPTDVTAAFSELTPFKGLRILATAEAPRIVVGGEPAGELALVPTAGQQIDIALHGPTTPRATTARKGGRDGVAVPLSPGTSDGTTRLPAPRLPPSAGLLTISGRVWAWAPVSDAE